MLRKFHPADWFFLIYAGVLTPVLLITGMPWGWAVAHAAIFVAVIARTKYGPKILFDWDAVPYVIFIFIATTELVHRVNPHDIDRWLITWDRAIGGLAILQWTQSWSTRFLDEIAKIVWTTFFFLHLIPAVALYRRSDKKDFNEYKLMLVAAYIISFSFYWFLPAQGPLYFKEELGLKDPTTGVVVAQTLKSVVSNMEGAEARNTFPSGHVMIAALVFVACFRYRLKWVKWICAPIALGIILSTVYLRYHYVVDVVAGLLLIAGIVCGAVWWYRRPADQTAVGIPEPSDQSP